MFKVELVDSNESVVGFFEVAHNITLSALAYWVDGAVEAHNGGVIRWQVRRPDGRILCQVKVQVAT